MDQLKLTDFEALTAWGCVAFAARCVRRSFPLCRGAVSDEILGQLQYAIELSEEAASRASVGAGENIINAGNDLAASLEKVAFDDSIKVEISDLVYAGDRMAGSASYYGLGGEKEVSVTAACAAYEAASKSVGPVGVAATLRDYRLLLHATNNGRWDDDTPVSPEFFGPLWPFGEPEGWPKSPDENEDQGQRTLQLTVDLPPGVDDEAIVKVVAGLAEQADGLHAAYGGAGLTIENVKVESHVPAEVEV